MQTSLIQNPQSLTCRTPNSSKSCWRQWKSFCHHSNSDNMQQMRQELCTELSPFGREPRPLGRKMGLLIHHWTGILKCHVAGEQCKRIGCFTFLDIWVTKEHWKYWLKKTSICPRAHVCVLKTRLVLRLGLQLEKWGAWLGGLWGRRKAGNDCGSCLPADDKLQLLVGAFHQGDGLSPGAAQLHLVDVHHFITSLQLGRQGICLPSLFNLHRREGRRSDIPDMVWLLAAELSVCFCWKNWSTSPKFCSWIKKPGLSLPASSLKGLCLPSLRFI